VGGKTDNTRLGYTGGGGTTRARVNAGGGHLSEYIFLDSVDSSSLSKSRTRLTPSLSAEFENPTSAPLIAPVVTITPIPLLYNVGTLYIVRYNPLTTHPSQPTHIFKELHKKEKEKETKEVRKKGKRKTLTKKHSQNKTKYNIHIIIIIQIITTPTSTTSLQVIHFKSKFHILKTLPTYKYITSRQHLSVQGPLWECP